MDVHARGIGRSRTATSWAFFHRLAEDDMAEIQVDVWLYGRLARYAGTASGGGYANVKLSLPAGSTMRHL